MDHGVSNYHIPAEGWSPAQRSGLTSGGTPVIFRFVTGKTPALAALLSLVVVSAPARAGGPGFRFKIHDKVMAGQGQPGLALLPNTTVKNVKLTLRTGSGKKIVRKAKRINVGREHTFHWKQRPGKMRYKATITAVDTSGHETTSQFEFEVVVSQPMTVRVDKGLDQLKDHRISLRADQAIAKVEYEIHDKAGEVVQQGTTEFGGGSRSVDVQWEPFEGVIGRILLKAFDANGFWAGVELAPFWVEIPHEEVEFAFGKWDVRASERHKLDDAFAAIQAETIRQKEAARWGVHLDLRLYVGGYTDTVGKPADNQLLSERRARSIARYLRKLGFKGPIYYQGFGESALAVKTPDETKEAKNRRAMYILANAPPPRSGAIPRASWSRLK